LPYEAQKFFARLGAIQGIARQDRRGSPGSPGDRRGSPENILHDPPAWKFKPTNGFRKILQSKCKILHSKSENLKRETVEIKAQSRIIYNLTYRLHVKTFVVLRNIMPGEARGLHPPSIKNFIYI